jgi:uncharacterized protein YkwD
MPRIRRLAALTVIAAFLAGAAAVWGADSGSRRLVATPPTTTIETTTTEAPILAAMVASGTVSLEEETAIIEEVAAAAESTTTTLPPSTTTTVATTTTAEAKQSPTTEARKESPNTTSPPTTAPPTTAAGGYDSGAESDFASRINSYRENNGKSSLSRDGSLDSYARSWAKKLAENGGLSHSNIGSLVPPWTSVGENVGSGGSAGQIFDALAGSGPHTSTMLGDFTHFGIGAYRDSSGLLWTAQVFTR